MADFNQHFINRKNIKANSGNKKKAGKLRDKRAQERRDNHPIYILLDRYGRFLVIGALILIVLGFMTSALITSHKNKVLMLRGYQELDEGVTQWQSLVHQYAKENGIENYEEYLLAIIAVETGGTKSADVMQSSESQGLLANSLNEEESIKQGCLYFAALVAKARNAGCDMNTVVQAYNYGSDFIDYVSSNGDGVYSIDLAEKFAYEKSSGATVSVDLPFAYQANGGWRYKFGNMFYVFEVNRYVKHQLKLR
jgi:hypothetical protein